jgi:hypothetical protein
VESLFSSHVCHLSFQLALRLADEVVPEEAQVDLRRSVWEYIRANAGVRPEATMSADSAAVKAIHPLPDEAVRMAMWEVAKALARKTSPDWREWEAAICRAKESLMPLVRDIFGNPFRPVSFDPVWRTSTAVALARQMYESRDFGAMPILADALQDAGCDVDDVLNHCRDPHATHVRGCWVVDLLLGKE